MQLCLHPLLLRGVVHKHKGTAFTLIVFLTRIQSEEGHLTYSGKQILSSVLHLKSIGVLKLIESDIF
jgi:NADH:ubiquinone oxidoreductase subunit E